MHEYTYNFDIFKEIVVIWSHIFRYKNNCSPQIKSQWHFLQEHKMRYLQILIIVDSYK
jgi:hypothetical protein